jgi:putative transport protein
MSRYLGENPLLLLFGVGALGYLAGRASFRGFSLGVSAVLFAGLLIGYLLPNVGLPHFVSDLGLVVCG